MTQQEVVTVPDLGDPEHPFAIEVLVEKPSPISLALLTKLLRMGIVFLATRHLPASLAIVSVALSTFIPDVVSALIRRLDWGKKRVASLAAVVSFFASIDSFFGGEVVPRLRRAGAQTVRSARAGVRHAVGTGHALGTSAAATAMCAAAIAAPAIATGSSPFGSGHSSPTPARHGAPAASAPAAVAQPGAATPAGQATGFGSSSWRASLTVTPGQNAHIPITLAHTSKVLLALSPSSTLTRLTVSYDGGQNGQYYGTPSAGNIYVLESLAAGHHTLEIEPDGIASGTLRYTVYIAPNVIQPIAGSSAGVSGAVTVTPGQNAELTFALRHAGKILFALSPRSTLTALTVSHDGGQDDQYYGTPSAGNIYTLESFSAGRHTLQIEPDGIASGTLRYTLYTPASK